jgi:predicted phage terminase large subunit-like protein
MEVKRNSIEAKELALKEMLARAKAEESFYEFCKQAWHLIEGDNPFVESWASGAICEHLQAVIERQIRFLIVNAPPRIGKSTILSVFLCPWAWIEHCDERFLYSSYSHNLSMRDSVRARRIIQSDWYNRRWGSQYNLIDDQNTKIKFDNTKSGTRMCTSQNSSTTGEGGSLLILDDPNAASDMNSDVVRESRNLWHDSTWSTRMNNPKRDCRIIMQQRIHEKDITGHVISNDIDGMYTKLILPLEYESSRKCKTIILPSTKGKIWEDPRKLEGELLVPERIGPIELAQLKSGLGSQYRIAGQLQQRPAPEEGGILKKHYFKWWKMSAPPKIEHTIQSWDTALGEKDDHCYSCCTTWGLFYDETKTMNLILLAMWRGKLEYPELRKLAQRLYRNYLDDDIHKPKPSNIKNVPDVVLIEGKSSGLNLIQDFMIAGITATKFNPDKYGDKIGRVRSVSHLLEAGRVWVPAQPPDYHRLRDYADILVTQAATFPAAESRDLVDTMTQVMLRLRDSGYLTNPLDASMFSNQPKDTLRKSKRAYY